MTNPTKPSNAVKIEQPGEMPAVNLEKLETEAPEGQPDAPPPANDAVKPKQRVREKADLRKMHAADIDAATLTAPVLCLDGWVCPNPPEKAK